MSKNGGQITPDERRAPRSRPLTREQSAALRVRAHYSLPQCSDPNGHMPNACALCPVTCRETSSTNHLADGCARDPRPFPRWGGGQRRFLLPPRSAVPHWTPDRRTWGARNQRIVYMCFPRGKQDHSQSELNLLLKRQSQSQPVSSICFSLLASI